MTDGWMTNYARRVNDMNLAAQHADVKRTAKEILEEIKTISQYMYWTLDPDEKDPSYFCTTLIEHAHTLVDLGHAWRAVIAANPPPKVEEEDAA